jgi:aminodeoxychorismate lyase
MKSEIYLFNGKKVEGKEIGFNELKRGFLYGDGIFETLLAKNKKIFRFEEHWERMKKGANICNLKIPEKERVKEIILKNLKEKDKDYYIRINLWREKPEKFSPSKEKESNFLIIIKEFEPYSSKFYEDGINCIISEKVRRNEKSIISKIKSLSFIENVIVKIECEKEKCDDAIILNTSGYISEGSVSNIFFVKDDCVYTPSIECGCLEGITRKVIFEICEKNGIKVKEGFFKLEFLRKVNEVFLTNTLMGIMPVREIKNCFVVKEFRITQSLIKKYNENLRKETK